MKIMNNLNLSLANYCQSAITAYTRAYKHIATSLQDCRNSKFGKIELYEPQDSPINSAFFGYRVVILSALLATRGRLKNFEREITLY